MGESETTIVGKSGGRSRSAVAVFILLLTIASVLAPQVEGQSASSSPFGSLSFDNSMLAGNATSATLASGSQTYLWAFDTGGELSSGNLSVGAKDSLHTGFALGAQVGESKSNGASFPTKTFYHSMGGAGISGFAGETYLSVKTNPGVYSAKITVTPTQPCLVVVIALQAGDGYSASLVFGESTRLTTDQAMNRTNPNVVTGPQPMVIAHAFLQPGTYQFTTSIRNIGGEVASYAEMITVWFFTATTASSPIGLSAVEIATIVIIVVVAAGAGIFAVRRGKKPAPA